MPPSPSAKRRTYVEDLTQILGDDFVHHDEDGAITVLPGDTQQVSSILRFANTENLTVEPRGAGTKQGWTPGSLPHLRLCLSRFNQLIDHPWQDLTCTVQAGCTWSSLQQNLAKHGQFVALDPLFANHATVGGVLAVNDSGSLRQRYGSLRDLVIGMTLVLPDGTIARTGGRVVKNVAGYDLSKLMIGSMGTLAIITEVNFRLHALPQYVRTYTIAAPDAARFARLLGAIRASHLLTQALQIRRDNSGAHLDISLTSHPAAQQDESLSRMVHAEGFTIDETAEASCFERDQLLGDGATFIRAATLPSDVCEFVDELQRASEKCTAISTSQAIGLHNIALHGSCDEVARIIHHLRALRSTSITVLRTDPGVEAHPFTIPTPVMSVMQAIKRTFDPNGILSPGKFFVTQ